MEFPSLLEKLKDALSGENTSNPNALFKKYLRALGRESKAYATATWVLGELRTRHPTMFKALLDSIRASKVGSETAAEEEIEIMTGQLMGM